LVPGVNVRENADFVFPAGPMYSDFDSFKSEGMDLPIVPMSERPLAFSFAGSVNFRKPTRYNMDRTFNKTLSTLRNIANAHNLGVLYEMVDGNSYGENYNYEDITGFDYVELLRYSRLSLSPVGDQWLGGRIFQALELGAIPVVENLDEYKGCTDPTYWLKEQGAPILLVDSWEDLGEVLQWALDNPDELASMQEEMMEWWDQYRRVSMEKLVSFAEATRSGDYTVKHTCFKTELSQEEMVESVSGFTAYYSQPDWFSSFEDQPDLCALYCTTAVTSFWSKVDDTDGCFSNQCAPNPLADFTCELLE